MFFKAALVMLFASTAVLAIACVFTANNMSKATCLCIKTCLVLIIAGCASIFTSFYYGWPSYIKIFSVLPIMWGVAGWMFFDRYRAHEDIDRLREQIKSFIKNSLHLQ